MKLALDESWEVLIFFIFMFVASFFFEISLRKGMGIGILVQGILMIIDKFAKEVDDE